MGERRPVKNKVPKRSWLQDDLDEEIRTYAAKRAINYRELVDAVKNGDPGAIKSARTVFGRNALARALGVKSPAMITKSPAWQEIAAELGLPRGKQLSKLRQRVGLDMALEDDVDAANRPVINQVIENETIRLIRKYMPTETAECILERIERGEITDDEARELVAQVKSQQQDDRSYKVPSQP